MGTPLVTRFLQYLRMSNGMEYEGVHHALYVRDTFNNVITYKTVMASVLYSWFTHWATKIEKVDEKKQSLDTLTKFGINVQEYLKRHRNKHGMVYTLNLDKVPKSYEEETCNPKSDDDDDEEID